MFRWVRQRALGVYKYGVDKDVPIPPALTGKGQGDAWRSTRSYFYPFEIMELGDSFLVPYGKEKPVKVRNRVNASACNHGRATGRAYTVRSMEEGVRVWLVAE